MLGKLEIGARRAPSAIRGRLATMGGAVSVAMFAVLALAAPALGSPGVTTRVSVASDGTQSSAGSQPGNQNAATSADGRVTAFQSTATNLVADDTNGATDVFVRDDGAQTTTRVSVATDGTQGNLASTAPSVSGDGRYVAFSSTADNLVAGDTSGGADIFVRDWVAGTTTLVSRASDGGSQNGGIGAGATISADGRYVAFTSDASNLVAGDTNAVQDVFVRDLQTNTTTRVSLTDADDQASAMSANVGTPNAISADGRYVAFRSLAALVPADTNDTGDIYVRDRTAGTTTLASIADDGTMSTALTAVASLSADGRHVAFVSTATNLVAGDTNAEADIFVRDLDTAKTVRVSVAGDGAELNSTSSFPSISADGRVVAFATIPPVNPPPRLVYVRDRDVSASGTFDTAGNTATTLESVADDGTAASNTADRPSLASDGTLVAFDSTATNLVPNDTNTSRDIFTHTLALKALTVSKAGAGNGTVTSVPAGIDCGSFCSRGFNSGTSVTLTATPATGSAFTGFSGAGCSGTGSSCTVTVDQTRLVTATFATPFAVSVTKAGTGQGSVTSSPAGITCGATCTADFNSGTQVTLTATPAAGSSFAGFTGAGCSGTASSCTVTVDQARSVTATFAAQLAVSITKAGTGQGTVTSTPAGISCGTTCTANFNAGSEVTLTATPAAGSSFAGFSGAGCSGTTTSCTVTADQARSLTATFTTIPTTPPPPPPPPITVPPPPAPAPNPPAATPDKTAPSISRFGLKNNPFVLGAPTRRYKKGTAFRYTLSEAASVRIVISQRVAGRRKGTRCVTPTRSLRKARACTRTLRRGTLTRAGRKGANTLAFSGRIGSRTLKPGRYRATITATDAARNASRPRTVSFTIAKR